MGFDQDSDLPIIQPQKRTTQVNVAMVALILIFFFATAAVTFWIWRQSEDPAVRAPAGSESR
ncbi:hypothetical protein [Horticoccus sp. 23ND18S-11]|uniref:hypothetical protein n=1 Tax=Horticoccus sp. 23ND18S-11 TaxID=3391832 RepID=UPI0039C8E17B